MHPPCFRASPVSIVVLLIGAQALNFGIFPAYMVEAELLNSIGH